MIDTKVVLVLALLLGLMAGDKPPAGGVPIPQHGIGHSQ
jgi:hypothetical protein